MLVCELVTTFYIIIIIIIMLMFKLILGQIVYFEVEKMPPSLQLSSLILSLPLLLLLSLSSCLLFLLLSSQLIQASRAVSFATKICWQHVSSVCCDDFFTAPILSSSRFLLVQSFPPNPLNYLIITIKYSPDLVFHL